MLLNNQGQAFSNIKHQGINFKAGIVYQFCLCQLDQFLNCFIICRPQRSFHISQHLILFLNKGVQFLAEKKLNVHTVKFIYEGSWSEWLMSLGNGTVSCAWELGKICTGIKVSTQFWSNYGLLAFSDFSLPLASSAPPPAAAPPAGAAAAALPTLVIRSLMLTVVNARANRAEGTKTQAWVKLDLERAL